MTEIVTTDVVIIGGGVAGLWLNQRLRHQGFSTLLFERGNLGAAQTLHSQGIIHGGTKYALSGALTGAANAIADMPARWRACLAGEGDVDLREAHVLSEHHYMWSKAQLASKLTTFFASKAVRGKIDPVANTARPKAFQDPGFKGRLYALNELVLDVPSIVKALAEPAMDSLYQFDCAQPGVIEFDGQQVTSLCLSGKRRTVHIKAQRYVFAAGEGNEALLHGAGLLSPAMQRRPLHMVAVTHDYPHPIFAHCIGTGSKPILTITSHPGSDGRQTWYLGGNLAEAGVERNSAEQIAAAEKLLSDLLPWVDLGQAKWNSFFINRAEPRQSNLLRPDTAFVERHGNLLTCWPTKLALSPNLADEVVAMLEQDGIRPHAAFDPNLLAGLPRPAIGTPAWNQTAA